MNTQIGTDTLGGQFLNQVVSEYYDSGDSCTASDGSLGELLYLSEALGVNTYVFGGQVYIYSDSGSQCISLTTGVLSGSAKFSIFGGTGKFYGANGSFTAYFTGTDLDSPQSPGSGFFGAVQASYTGNVTP